MPAPPQRICVNFQNTTPKKPRITCVFLRNRPFKLSSRHWLENSNNFFAFWDFTTYRHANIPRRAVVFGFGALDSNNLHLTEISFVSAHPWIVETGNHPMPWERCVECAMEGVRTCSTPSPKFDCVQKHFQTSV